jgi:hypothetical protein
MIDAPGADLQRRLGLVLLLGGAVLVAGLTLTPQPDQVVASGRTSMICLWCGDLGTIDVVLNLLLFVPLGAGLALVGVRPGLAVAGMALLSLAVETAQLTLIVGRDASLSDLLTNSAGGAAGVLLARSWRGWILCGPAEARRLALAAGIAWLLVAVLSCVALRPAPTTLLYYGQLAPELGGFALYRGEVVAATVSGLPVVEGPLRGSDRTQADLERGSFRFSARTRTGTAPLGLAPVVRLADQEYAEIALLGQDGDALVFRVRLAAARLGLRVPGARLAAVFPSGERAQGSTRDLEGDFDGHSLRVRAVDGGITREWRVAFGPHLGWALWLPVRFELRAGTIVLDVLWVAAWFGLGGWWLGRWPVRRPANRLGFVAVVAAMSLCLVPLLFGFPVSPLHAWIGAVIGAAAGLRLSRAILAHAAPPT